MDNQQADQKTTLTIKLALILGGLAVLAFIAFSIYSASKFRIVSIDPTPKNISTVTPLVKINFNKKLSASGLSVNGSAKLIRNYTVVGKTLEVTLNYPLEAGKVYSLSIDSITSVDEKIITNKVFTFSPFPADSNNLSVDQKNALINDQDKNQGAAADPIMQYLPYGTLDFSLTGEISNSSDGKTQLTIEAKLLLSHADMSNQDAAISQYKKEVTDYITSLGLDPTKYKINYTVITPAG